MITLSENQVIERRDSLPQNLLDVLSDDETSNIIWGASEAEKIPDKKIYVISKVAGAVLMGFLRPENLAQELRDQINLDPQSAVKIQTALNTKLFLPLKPDLDKIYQPVGAPQPKAITMDLVPPTAGANAGKSNVPVPIPVAPPKAPLSEKGWSKMSPVSISSIPTAPTKPAAPSLMPFTPSVAVPLAPKAPGGTAVVPTPTPTAAKPVAEPAPMIFQTDVAAKTAQKNVDFHLNRTGSGAEMSLGAPKAKIQTTPAMIEFRGSNSAIPKPPTAPMGTARYSEFRTSLSSVPTATSGTRNISEVTSAPAPAPIAKPTPMPVSVPLPPKPPTPPAPMAVSRPASFPVAAAIPTPISTPVPPPTPKPPAPPTPTGKVIVKNFP
jgi:hypothetical protein